MGEVHLWEQSLRNLKTQAGKSAIIKKDGGEMLVAIVLDKPLAAVKALVEDPTKLIAEIMQILQDKQAHPVLAQMVNPDVRDDLPISEFATASSTSGGSRTRRSTQPNEQQDRFQWTCIRSRILPTWETHDWSYP